MARALKSSSIAVAVALLPFGIAADGRAQAWASRSADDEAIETAGARLIAVLDVPLHSTVAASPDGRFYAAVQARPDPTLWIIPRAGRVPFALRKSWAAFKPRWSPAGDRIGFIAGVGPPRVWTIEVDPATGRPTDPPRLLHRSGANAFAFAPDGERIAIVERRSTGAGTSEIRIIEWESRGVHTLLREAGVIYQLDWAPDGRFIYYGLAPRLATPDSPHQIRRVSLADGTRETLRESCEFLGLSPDGEFLLHVPARSELEGAKQVAWVQVDGGHAIRFTLDPRVKSASWAANSRALVQVSSAGTGVSVWEVPLCPICLFTAW